MVPKHQNGTAAMITPGVVAYLRSGLCCREANQPCRNGQRDCPKSRLLDGSFRVLLPTSPEVRLRGRAARAASKGHHSWMFDHRALSIGAIVTGLMAHGAWAQYCDDRFPWSCRVFGNPPPPMVLPGPPFPPRDYGSEPQPQPFAPGAPVRPGDISRPLDPALMRQYAGLYARVDGEPFPIPAVRLSEIDPEYLRKVVVFPTNEQLGTIVVDATNHFLYLAQGGGRAIRYGVGVGRQGFGWSGVATVHDKQEWPDWYPTKERIARQPELRRQVTELQGGLGVPGGPRNPLGSRAMYLWQGNKDTLYRIHGTVEPWTIGTSVSSGCIRMINQDVIDLYQRAQVGARVVVLSARETAPAGLYEGPGSRYAR